MRDCVEEFEFNKEQVYSSSLDSYEDMFHNPSKPWEPNFGSYMAFIANHECYTKKSYPQYPRHSDEVIGTDYYPFPEEKHEAVLPHVLSSRLTAAATALLRQTYAGNAGLCKDSDILDRAVELFPFIEFIGTLFDLIEFDVTFAYVYKNNVHVHVRKDIVERSKPILIGTGSSLEKACKDAKSFLCLHPSPNQITYKKNWNSN